MDEQRRIVMAAGLLSLALGARALAQAQPRTIKVSAKRFTFTPSEIALKKGEPVVFELTTEDVFMGFNAPDFGVRSDIVPGKTAKVPLTPNKTGTFIFLCDVFCGDGHETMSGRMVVT
jgi:cytochrome c oxidase subunit II